MIKYKNLVCSSIACLVVFALMITVIVVRSSQEKNSILIHESITDIKPETILRVDAEQENEKFSIFRKENKWISDKGVELNAKLATDYLNGLCRIEGYFVCEGNDTGEYGFENAVSTVVITNTEGQIILKLGNKTFSQSEYYLKTHNGKVYTVYSDVGRIMQTRADSLRGNIANLDMNESVSRKEW